MVDAPGPGVRSAGGRGVGHRSGGAGPGAGHGRAVRSRPVDDDHRAPDLDRSDHHRDHDHRAARHGWRGGHDQRARQGRTGLDDHQQPAPLDDSTTTTTTTILAIASGTWITAPGYNPEWHSINPPWVLKPPPDSGEGRRIVYSKFQQRVWLMEDNGYITNTHLVSGRYDIPAFGVYHVYSKSLSTFATHNPSIIWNYMVRFAVGPQGGGIGLHEIPTQYGRPVQTVEQLGQPLSGGCLRQAHDDAVLVWNWAPVGTTVVVVP